MAKPNDKIQPEINNLLNGNPQNSDGIPVVNNDEDDDLDAVELQKAFELSNSLMQSTVVNSANTPSDTNAATKAAEVKQKEEKTKTEDNLIEMPKDLDLNVIPKIAFRYWYSTPEGFAELNNYVDFSSIKAALEDGPQFRETMERDHLLFTQIRDFIQAHKKKGLDIDKILSTLKNTNNSGVRLFEQRIRFWETLYKKEAVLQHASMQGNSFKKPESNKIPKNEADAEKGANVPPLKVPLQLLTGINGIGRGLNSDKLGPLSSLIGKGKKDDDMDEATRKAIAMSLGQETKPMSEAEQLRQAILLSQGENPFQPSPQRGPVENKGEKEKQRISQQKKPAENQKASANNGNGNSNLVRNMKPIVPLTLDEQIKELREKIAKLKGIIPNDEENQTTTYKHFTDLRPKQIELIKIRFGDFEANTKEAKDKLIKRLKELDQNQLMMLGKENLQNFGMEGLKALELNSELIQEIFKEETEQNANKKPIPIENLEKAQANFDKAKNGLEKAETDLKAVVIKKAILVEKGLKEFANEMSPLDLAEIAKSALDNALSPNGSKDSKIIQIAKDTLADLEKSKTAVEKANAAVANAKPAVEEAKKAIETVRRAQKVLEEYLETKQSAERAFNEAKRKILDRHEEIENDFKAKKAILESMKDDLSLSESRLELLLKQKEQEIADLAFIEKSKAEVQKAETQKSQKAEVQNSDAQKPENQASTTSAQYPAAEIATQNNASVSAPIANTSSPTATTGTVNPVANAEGVKPSTSETVKPAENSAVNPPAENPATNDTPKTKNPLGLEFHFDWASAESTLKQIQSNYQQRQQVASQIKTPEYLFNNAEWQRKVETEKVIRQELAKREKTNSQDANLTMYTQYTNTSNANASNAMPLSLLPPLDENDSDIRSKARDSCC